MYNIRQAIAILAAVSFIGCNSRQVKNDVLDTNVNAAEFKEYLKRFQVLTLPVKIKYCSIDCNNLPVLKPHDFPHFDSNEVAYCTFKTNGNYIATISFGIADCYLPTLTTYTQDGTKISQENFNIGGGSDCGYTSREIFELGNDYSIYNADTVFSYECDSLGNPVPGTTENYVTLVRGRLLSSGKIELAKENKELLR